MAPGSRPQAARAATPAKLKCSVRATARHRGSARLWRLCRLARARDQHPERNLAERARAGNHQVILAAQQGLAAVSAGGRAARRLRPIKRTDFAVHFVKVEGTANATYQHAQLGAAEPLTMKVLLPSAPTAQTKTKRSVGMSATSASSDARRTATSDTSRGRGRKICSYSGNRLLMRTCKLRGAVGQDRQCGFASLRPAPAAACRWRRRCHPCTCDASESRCAVPDLCAPARPAQGSRRPSEPPHPPTPRARPRGHPVGNLDGGKASSLANRPRASR